jgi:hypothetical protein
MLIANFTNYGEEITVRKLLLMFLIRSRTK